jgi:hypothetical protein
MEEQLYGVSFGRQNYQGRDEHGQIKLTRSYTPSDGRLQVRVIELLRGERDELTAESLADLGETTPLDVLVEAVKDCIRFGNTPQDILAAVNKACCLKAA